jgi:hypothetical protein
LKNAKFCFSGKEDENFNHRNTPPVFRGLKFEPDAEIGQKGIFFKGLIESNFTILVVGQTERYFLRS